MQVWVCKQYVYIHTYVTYVYVLVYAAKLHGVCWVCICKYLYNCAIRYDRSIYPPPGLLQDVDDGLLLSQPQVMESSCKIKWMGSSWIAATNYGWWWRHESQQTSSLLYPSTNLTCWMMSLLRDSASDSAGFCWLILWLLWLLGLLPLLTALAGPDSPSAHPGFQSSPGAAACVWGSQRRVIGSQKQNLAAWPCRDGRECQKPSFVPRIGKHITIDYWPNPPIPSVKTLNCIQLSWSSKYIFENKIKIKTIETLSCFRDIFQSVYHSLPLWCHHQLFALASPLVAMSQWRTWYVDCVGSWWWRAIFRAQLGQDGDSPRKDLANLGLKTWGTRNNKKCQECTRSVPWIAMVHGRSNWFAFANFGHSTSNGWTHSSCRTYTETIFKQSQSPHFGVDWPPRTRGRRRTHQPG